MLTPAKDLRTGNPLWVSQRPPQIPVEILTRDQATDVVIVGAGITGAMAAEALTQAGFQVILLDRRGPLQGATSATTALLQYEIDNPLSLLVRQIGQDKARQAWRRSKLALESLKAKIQSLAIPCAMKRLSSLYLAGDLLDAEGLREEARRRNEIGLYTDYLTRDTLRQTYGLRRQAALRSYDNLSVNPLRMAAGFLQAALDRGAKLFAPATADGVEAGREGVRLSTKEGPVIQAKHLIYATGYEMPKAVRTRRHSLHSTYALATKPQAAKLWPERCLIWEASDPYLYLRTTADGRVICGGEDEEFENEEKRDALLLAKTARLEVQLQGMFPQLDPKAEFAWCGSFGTSTTGLPTIGEIPGMKNCFAVMAYGGNGITFSRLGAELLTAKLTGSEDPEAELFAF
jgi:glycine/D-amino acid oxidase-like deaminating enzyme